MPSSEHREGGAPPEPGFEPTTRPQHRSRKAGGRGATRAVSNVADMDVDSYIERVGRSDQNQEECSPDNSNASREGNIGRGHREGLDERFPPRLTAQALQRDTSGLVEHPRTDARESAKKAGKRRANADTGDSERRPGKQREIAKPKTPTRSRTDDSSKNTKVSKTPKKEVTNKRARPTTGKLTSEEEWNAIPDSTYNRSAGQSGYTLTIPTTGASAGLRNMSGASTEGVVGVNPQAQPRRTSSTGAAVVGYARPKMQIEEHSDDRPADSGRTARPSAEDTGSPTKRGRRQGRQG